MSQPIAKVGPYELTYCVESGSSIQLWLAQRLHEGATEKVVVRLVVDPEDGMAVSRWRKELALQRTLVHPAIPALLAVFEDEKAFVMEWGDGIGGDGLVEFSCSGGVKAEPGSILSLGIVLLDVLSGLEEAGHIHGNLSPDKIRLGPSGSPKLYGWGARPDRVQPRYMAPEMVGQGEVGPQTDQWHIAVLLFELLMGRPLYDGEWSEVFRRALDGDNEEACRALSARYPMLAGALLPALRGPGFHPYKNHSEMREALAAAQLRVGAGPSLAEWVAELQGQELPKVDLATDEALLIPLDQEAQEEEAPEEEAPEEEAPEEEAPEEEPQESPPEEAPQLERVEIVLPQIVLPGEAAQKAESGDEEEMGPLGVGLTDWERAELACCQGAGPVERGSWWVARSGEQTRVQAPLSEPVPEEEAPSIEEAVALPEPEPEPEPIPPTVAHTPYPEVEPPSEVLFQEEKKEVPPPVLEELPLVPEPMRLPIQMPPMERLSLPGLEAVSQALSEEADTSEETEDMDEELPWNEPEIIIPAPPKPFEVEPPPPNVPGILSPRKPVERNRAEAHSWEHAWGIRPLSERISRGGLLVLLGMGLAWLVMG
jgi:hypothetical protein